MSSRFRPPAAALTSPLSSKCGSDPACKCCAAMRRARELALFDPLPEWCSPITPGVQLVNISHSKNLRNLRVDLGEDWARMFAQLTLTGHGLVMTRHAAAILGRRMKYPAFHVTSGGGEGASGESGLWIAFRHLGAARAVHFRRETGHVFGVEFADEAGHIVHRFTLTAESDMVEFFAWMRLHQACAAHEPARWRYDEEAAAADEMRTVRECDGGALVSVVAACVDRAMPLRATVRGSAVTQRMNFTPLSFQPCDEWWFVSDDTTGLHFQPELFASVTLEQRTRDDGESRVALRAATDQGAALVLEAGDPVAESAWRELLETIA